MNRYDADVGIRHGLPGRVIHNAAQNALLGARPAARTEHAATDAEERECRCPTSGGGPRAPGSGAGGCATGGAVGTAEWTARAAPAVSSIV